jgi:hypothetical protein
MSGPRPALVGATALALLMGCASPRPDRSEPAPVAERVSTPQDARPLAFVQFVDDIREEDLAWLRERGFEVVRIFQENDAVTVRVPLDYSADPLKENPRIKAFRVQMR